MGIKNIETVRGAFLILFLSTTAVASQPLTFQLKYSGLPNSIQSTYDTYRLSNNMICK
jgi:hypothetical protein